MLRIAILAALYSVTACTCPKTQQTTTFSETRRYYAPATMTFEHFDGIGNEGHWQSELEKWDFAYDNGRLVNKLIRQSDSTGALENQLKHDYSYGEDRLLRTESISKWEDDAWKEYYKKAYDYNQDGLLVAMTGSFQLGGGGAWHKDALARHSYDSNRRLVTETYGNAATVEENGRQTYEYDSDGRVVTTRYWSKASACIGRKSDFAEEFAYDDSTGVITRTIKRPGGGVAEQLTLTHDRGEVISEHFDTTRSRELPLRGEFVRRDHEVTITYYRLSDSVWEQRDRITTTLTENGTSAFWEGPWQPRPFFGGGDEEHDIALYGAVWNRYSVSRSPK